MSQEQVLLEVTPDPPLPLVSRVATHAIMAPPSHADLLVGVVGADWTNVSAVNPLSPLPHPHR